MHQVQNTQRINYKQNCYTIFQLKIIHKVGPSPLMTTKREKPPATHLLYDRRIQVQHSLPQEGRITKISKALP